MLGGARWTSLEYQCRAFRDNLQSGEIFHGARVTYLSGIGLPAALLLLLTFAMLPRFSPGWLSRWDQEMALNYSPPRPVRSLREAITLADGIDRAEASTIASKYFRRYGPEFGWIDPLVLVDDQWKSIVYIGTRGFPMLEPICVNARTGSVRWTNGRPSFPTVEAFARAIDDR
jgi:hypothetical protein